MSISIQKILGKIDQELQAAKNVSSASLVREKIYAIKTLCDLILEETETELPTEAEAAKFASDSPSGKLHVQQPRRMEMEDDANGESIFDF
ncbi:hypothetical protein PB1_07787 [Bacillus methanolicus PB1]|uniref:YwdI n=1 Tax=Bacillus methanolicus PB1 TaxID=997296 RepID=I3E174_BACMT|nr:YwdI family protein [Bacillus methanolicus]EIJ80245.1 hypothetical protein PB1_07787 [Bacillus methanolicus PB1]